MRTVADLPAATLAVAAGNVETGKAAALAHDGPLLIDAVASRQEVAMSPKITDEMVDRAHTKLWR